MPALLIGKIDGVMQASPANSGEFFALQTSDGDQSVALQQLVTAMRDGEGAMVNGAPEIFVIPEGYQPSQVVQSLFGTTDGIVFGGRPIYTCVGDDVILDDLDLAAEALAAVL